MLLLAMPCKAAHALHLAVNQPVLQCTQCEDAECTSNLRAGDSERGSPSAIGCGFWSCCAVLLAASAAAAPVDTHWPPTGSGPATAARLQRALESLQTPRVPSNACLHSRADGSSGATDSLALLFTPRRG